MNAWVNLREKTNKNELYRLRCFWNEISHGLFWNFPKNSDFYFSSNNLQRNKLFSLQNSLSISFSRHSVMIMIFSNGCGEILLHFLKNFARRILNRKWECNYLSEKNLTPANNCLSKRCSPCDCHELEREREKKFRQMVLHHFTSNAITRLPLMVVTT